MNHFLVFSGTHYENQGGWNDFRGSFATLSEARDCAAQRITGIASDGWAHVIEICDNHPSGLVVLEIDR